jgi:hypothetical protein
VPAPHRITDVAPTLLRHFEPTMVAGERAR